LKSGIADQARQRFDLVSWRSYPDEERA